MGLFSGKVKQTTSAPQWLTGQMEGIAGKGAELGARDPLSYVAPADPLQTQAGGLAGGLPGSPNYTGQAAGLISYNANAASPMIKGQSGTTFLDQWLNPATEAFVDTSLGGYDENAGMQRAQLDLDQARDSNWDSGGAIKGALFERGIGLDRANLEAGLRRDAFNTAAGHADADANRKQQAASLNAQLMAQGQERSLQAAQMLALLGFNNDANSRANIGTLLDAGGTLRDVAGEQAKAPLSLADWQAGLLGSLPTDAVISKTQTSDPSGMSKIGSLISTGAAIAGLFSDVRLKQDIETVGYDAKGRRWVEYAYVWAPQERVRGVIAQEVAQTDPEAVSIHDSGFLMVDYSKLEA